MSDHGRCKSFESIPAPTPTLGRGAAAKKAKRGPELLELNARIEQLVPTGLLSTVFMALCSKTDAKVLGLSDEDFHKFAAQSVEATMNRDLSRLVSTLDAYRVLTGDERAVTL